MEAEWGKKVLTAHDFTTPAYVFNLDVLTAHIDRIKELTEGHVNLCYAMKANPLLIRTINNHIGKIEVCSPGELAICMKCNIPGAHIIFSGVNKTKRDVEEALNYGVSVITVESKKHFDLIVNHCRHIGKSVHILLRLTSGAQFGMDEELVEYFIKNRNEYPELIIDGIHFFSGTQKKKSEKMEEELQFLHHFIQTMQEKYEYQTMILEYGAGLSVPYFEGEDFTTVYDNLESIIGMTDCLFPKVKVTLELGRFFTWSCGQYFTRVEDVKCNHGHNYAIVDGGIHHLNYYGQNMAMRVPKIQLHKDSSNTIQDEKDNTEEWTICGSLCTFADVLIRKWTGKRLSIGDCLVFENTGAYSVTEAPALFLSRRMPVIYEWSEKEGLTCIRDAKESFTLNCRVGE